jgi:hypothetical protein
MLRWLIVVVVIIAVASATWWLFGWTTGITPEGPQTAHRFFGRVTRLDDTTKVNGRMVRERILYRWSAPFGRGEGWQSCVVIPPERWQDRNNDGRWDTWLRRVGPDTRGECSVEYLVDTKGTGQPGWSFVVAYGAEKQQQADALVAARRGF